MSTRFVLVFNINDDELSKRYYTLDGVRDIPTTMFNTYVNVYANITFDDYTREYADLIAWATTARVGDTMDHNEGMWICLGDQQ